VKVRPVVLFHRASAVVWALLAVPALLWWPDSVAFVIVASVYANVKSDWGAAEAADDSTVLAELHRLNRMIASRQCPTCQVRDNP
jgi:hypothetical protein